MVMVPSTTPVFSHVFPMDKVFALQCTFYSADSCRGILDMPIHPQDWLLLWKQVAQSATTVKISNNWYRQKLKNHKDHIWTRAILHFIFLVKLGHPLEMTQHQDKSTIWGISQILTLFFSFAWCSLSIPCRSDLRTRAPVLPPAHMATIEKLLHC